MAECKRFQEAALLSAHVRMGGQRTFQRQPCQGAIENGGLLRSSCRCLVGPVFDV